MEIPAVNTIEYNIPKFWDDEFKHLDYIQEPFNDPVSVDLWIKQGYHNKITGDLCDMRHQLPAWAKCFITMYQDQGWQNIGLAFYRMRTGTVMPVHQDLYRRYIEIFNLQGQEHTIRRALVLLEDWKPGHYLEVDGVPYVDWPAGKTVEWVYDTPHSAANLGLEDRYTLQITGIQK
jgi:hypothetical protein